MSKSSYSHLHSIQVFVPCPCAVLGYTSQDFVAYWFSSTGPCCRPYIAV